MTDSGSGWVVDSTGRRMGLPPGVRRWPVRACCLGAGALFSRPGALQDDPGLFQPDMPMQDDGAIAPPPRHNDGTDCPPYVRASRGYSDRTDTSCGHSFRILGEPLSMRAELGGIHYALQQTPIDEELTILTDSLSTIHLLCRWRRKRIFTRDPLRPPS